MMYASPQEPKRSVGATYHEVVGDVDDRLAQIHNEEGAVLQRPLVQLMCDAHRNADVERQGDVFQGEDETNRQR